MEAVVSLSPHNKQIKAQRSRYSRSVNLLPTNNYPEFGTYDGGHKQPPLLPLPIPIVPKAQISNFSPSKKKDQKLARHQSLTPRKSPPSKPHIGRRSGVPEKASTGPSGPEPNELPRGVFMAPRPSAASQPPRVIAVDTDMFSGGSIFVLAPHPSSLPLPRFSLRPKLSCNAKAGVDAGATDGLRRILRLR